MLTKLWSRCRPNRGYSLVELLVALGIFSFIIPVIFAGFVATRDGQPQQRNRVQAAALLKETIEAVRVVRERGWVEFAVDGVYHPAIDLDTGTWVLVSGAENVGLLTRQVTISSVQRDPTSGEIVDAGGELDPSTKKVAIDISWNQPLVSNFSSSIYLTRYLDNLSTIHATVADFSLPGNVLDHVVIVNQDDGELRLDVSGPGHGNWCQPSVVAELDLPRNGAARAVTALEGEIFAGTGLNASGKSLTYVTATNQNPPQLSLFGSIDGYKTNDVFGVPGYGFLATDTGSEEVAIVNTSNMQRVGFYNPAPTNTSGWGLYIKDQVGYVAITNSRLYLFNANPSTFSTTQSQQELSSVSLAGNAKSVYVESGYAYVANDITTSQLQIVEVSNPNSPVVKSSLTLNGQQGRDVYVAPDGNRAYVVTAASATQPEFFIINIEDKTAPTVISSYDTNGMDPKAVEVVLDGNRALVAGTGGEEYQVILIANETSPARCGGLDDVDGFYDIAGVVEADGDAYAYANSGNSSKELKVIEGGPGGTFSLTGSYESSTIDAGTVTAFNRFVVSESEPAGSALRYQVAVALPQAGSCDGVSFTFVGPDSTSESYFDGGGAVPFHSELAGYSNPGQCFRYKVFFTTADMNVTPELLDFTVNYSP